MMLPVRAPESSASSDMVVPNESILSSSLTENDGYVVRYFPELGLCVGRYPLHMAETSPLIKSSLDGRSFLKD